MGHKQTALTVGAKAGFRQYVKRLSTFGEGTPQAAALDELLSAGNAKQQFAFYCDKFLSGTEQVVQERADTQREDAIAAILGESDEDEVGVEVEADKPGILAAMREQVGRKRTTRKASPKATKFPVGTVFVYHGKENDTMHEVVKADGKTKHGRAAVICANEKGKERPWNVKSLSIYADKGTVEIVS